MKSLPIYINEKLIIKQKQKITPSTKQELKTAILDHFNNGDGDLNDIDMSKLKKKDFCRLFFNLKHEIKKNNITKIDISDWKLKELYCDPKDQLGMFQRCEILETVILPDCLEVIDDFAFFACKNLDNIIIPDSVTSIGEHVFDICNRLTSLTIPDSVNSIGNNAFEGCSSLTSLFIPDSVQSIGYNAFYNCPNLTITVPNEYAKELILNSGFDSKIIIK